MGSCSGTDRLAGSPSQPGFESYAAIGWLTAKKLKALKAAGVHVVDSPALMGETVNKVLGR